MILTSNHNFTPGVCIGPCQKHISEWPVQYPHYMVADQSMFFPDINMTTLAILCQADHATLSDADKARWRVINGP